MGKSSLPSLTTLVAPSKKVRKPVLLKPMSRMRESTGGGRRKPDLLSGKKKKRYITTTTDHLDVEGSTSSGGLTISMTRGGRARAVVGLAQLHGARTVDGEEPNAAP
jgi:hypothetical protein